MARAYAELFTPRPFNLTTFPNDEGYDELVAGPGDPGPVGVRAPPAAVHGTAHVGYLPGHRILGLSKLARVVEHFAAGPQVQERLTKQVADWLHANLRPQRRRRRHRGRTPCMTLRGVRAVGSAPSPRPCSARCGRTRGRARSSLPWPGFSTRDDLAKRPTRSSIFVQSDGVRRRTSPEAGWGRGRALADRGRRVHPRDRVHRAEGGWFPGRDGDGRQGLASVRAGSFDAVILDVMLPSLDGFGVCREIRRFSRVPIVMLTARTDLINVVVGLDLARCSSGSHSSCRIVRPVARGAATCGGRP